MKKKPKKSVLIPHKRAAVGQKKTAGDHKRKAAKKRKTASTSWDVSSIQFDNKGRVLIRDLKTAHKFKLLMHRHPDFYLGLPIRNPPPPPGPVDGIRNDRRNGNGYGGG